MFHPCLKILNQHKKTTAVQKGKKKQGCQRITENNDPFIIQISFINTPTLNLIAGRQKSSGYYRKKFDAPRALHRQNPMTKPHKKSVYLFIGEATL